MFKEAISNILDMCNCTEDFALIIDYSDKIIKIVDANEYENDILSINFVDDEIECYNEEYTEYPYIVDTIEELNIFVLKNILILKFKMVLDEMNINTNNFKEINEWLSKVKTMYIFN